MKIRSSRIISGLFVLSLALVVVWLILPRNPYARLEFTGKMALALSSGGSLHFLSRIASMIHCPDPGVYFSQEADREEQALLASGHLVRTRIKISDSQSSREALTALWYRHRRTGAYWSGSVERTNHMVVLVSKPKDVASFAAALGDN